MDNEQGWRKSLPFFCPLISLSPELNHGWHKGHKEFLAFCLFFRGDSGWGTRTLSSEMTRFLARRTSLNLKFLVFALQLLIFLLRLLGILFRPRLGWEWHREVISTFLFLRLLPNCFVRFFAD